MAFPFRVNEQKAARKNSCGFQLSSLKLGFQTDVKISSIGGVSGGSFFPSSLELIYKEIFSTFLFVRLFFSLSFSLQTMEEWLKFASLAPKYYCYHSRIYFNLTLIEFMPTTKSQRPKCKSFCRVAFFDLHFITFLRINLFVIWFYLLVHLSGQPKRYDFNISIELNLLEMQLKFNRM